MRLVLLVIFVFYKYVAPTALLTLPLGYFFPPNKLIGIVYDVSLTIFVCDQYPVGVTYL